jgi:hypothetical protein
VGDIEDQDQDKTRAIKGGSMGGGVAFIHNRGLWMWVWVQGTIRGQLAEGGLGGEIETGDEDEDEDEGR